MKSYLAHCSNTLRNRSGSLIVLFVTLLLILWTALRWKAPDDQISRLLGGSSYARILANPEDAELFVTTRFMATLTNGAQPDKVEKIEPGTRLPRLATGRINRIL